MYKHISVYALFKVGLSSKFIDFPYTANIYDNFLPTTRVTEAVKRPTMKFTNEKDGQNSNGSSSLLT